MFVGNNLRSESESDFRNHVRFSSDAWLIIIYECMDAIQNIKYLILYIQFPSFVFAGKA